MSRVRFAAQKPRALDIDPGLPENTSGYESEGKEQRMTNPAARWPPDFAGSLSLLQAKNGLDFGVHFTLETAVP
jgi:hypothetical protein